MACAGKEPAAFADWGAPLDPAAEYELRVDLKSGFDEKAILEARKKAVADSRPPDIPPLA